MTARLYRVIEIGVGLVVAAAIAWYAWQHTERTAAIRRDLGPVPLNAHQNFALEVTNPDDVSRELENATPSCTCLTILEAPRSVPARGKALIRIRFTPERPGPSTADVVLSWKIPPSGAPQNVWRIRAEVIPPPEAFPTADAIAHLRGLLRDGTIAAAAAAVIEPTSLILDVRSDAEFQNATIPGAMHLPTSALSSLPDSLRQKNALLLDHGIGSTATLDLVGQLRVSGWPGLRVIEGGLLGWQAHGGRITKEPSPTVRAISSAEARQCCTRPGWIVVAPTTLSTNWHLNELFADMLNFDPTDAPDNIAQALSRDLQARQIGEGATTTTLHILIATESGEQADQIAGALQSKSIAMPVFVLAGGVRGYLDHLRNLHPPKEHHWTTLADYRGVLADLRQRQRLVSACSSCNR